MSRDRYPDHDVYDRDLLDRSSDGGQVRVVRKPEQPPSQAGHAQLVGCPKCGTAEIHRDAHREDRVGPRLGEVDPETVESLLLRHPKRVSSEAALSSGDEFHVVACGCGLSGRVATSPLLAADSWRRVVATWRRRRISTINQRT